MSSFHTYWVKLRAKNPSLSRPTAMMTISVESFQKQLARAHADGAGEKESPRQQGSGLEDLFGSFFGGKK